MECSVCIDYINESTMRGMKVKGKEVEMFCSYICVFEDNENCEPADNVNNDTWWRRLSCRNVHYTKDAVTLPFLNR